MIGTGKTSPSTYYINYMNRVREYKRYFLKNDVTIRYLWVRIYEACESTLISAKWYWEKMRVQKRT